MPYLLLVWVHVLAAIAWIGGMLFVGVILVPLVRDMSPRDRAAILGRVGLRFSVLGWTCIGILLFTGPWLLLLRGRLELLLHPSTLIGVPVGHVIMVKLGVIFIMVLLSLVHDFWLGPKLVAALAGSGNPGAADPARLAPLRRGVAWLARLNVGLGVLVVALGVVLGRM
jgi:uncharacterized membrane protein